MLDLNIIIKKIINIYLNISMEIISHKILISLIRVHTTLKHRCSTIGHAIRDGKNSGSGLVP